jgi:hypothetical protein
MGGEKGPVVWEMRDLRRGSPAQTPKFELCRPARARLAETQFLEPIGPGERSLPMHPRSAYLVSVLGAAFAALCFVAALPTPMVALKPDAGLLNLHSDTTADTVNRAAKGDRLRTIVRPPDAEPFEVQAPNAHPDLGRRPPDGCESAFGQLDHSSVAKLAQACVT